MADQRNEFIANGWRQFSIIRPSGHRYICQYAKHITINANNDLLLIITQTCDLVSDVDKEPFFEVVLLRPLDRPPGNEFQHGKNARRLELTLEIEGNSQHYFIMPHERFFVRHERIKNIRPYEAIQDKTTTDLLIKWLTNRYSRTAFPDAFDRRWKTRKKQIEGIIKQLLLVQDIYIKLVQFGELIEGEEYEVEILLLMDAKYFDSPETYEKYDRLRKRLEDQFIQCDGINVESIDLASNAQKTIGEIQGYARWDYSYLSYRDPVNNEFPA